MLKPCAECGNDVSTNAKACPHCGNEPKDTCARCVHCRGDIRQPSCISPYGVCPAFTDIYSFDLPERVQALKRGL